MPSRRSKMREDAWIWMVNSPPARMAWTGTDVLWLMGSDAVYRWSFYQDSQPVEIFQPGDNGIIREIREVSSGSVLLIGTGALRLYEQGEVRCLSFSWERFLFWDTHTFYIGAALDSQDNRIYIFTSDYIHFTNLKASLE